MQVRETDARYLCQTYARQPLTLVSGSGALLVDDAGKAYIDLGSGIAVNTFGACDNAWADAVCTQARLLQHTSNYYYTAPMAQLARMLCEKTGLARVFFCNSGAEANEGAIKVARKYASDKYGERARPIIITLENSFHGRTVTTLSATGQDAFHHQFGPFTPGFAHVPAGDIGAMEAALQNDDVCGVLLELVQGEGGVVTLEKDYVRAVADLCARHDALLMIDEVQTGNGRTGTLYAYMQYGIHPDVVTTAKGLAGGLPLGAVMLGQRCEGTLTPGSHGSTFGGNPVCCAAALSVLSRLDETLLAGVRARRALIEQALQGVKGVQDVSGLGLMVGIRTCRDAHDVMNACRARGVLVLTAKDKVRLLPPLNIPMDVLNQGLTILKEELAK